MPSPLFSDLDRELTVTRRVLEAIPPDRYGWKSHDRAMTLGQLALHVAECVHWAAQVLSADRIDSAAMMDMPKAVDSQQMLLARFDRFATMARAATEAFQPAWWDGTWTLTRGDAVVVSAHRGKAYREWSLNHLIHHRGQLCTHLRLAGAKVPVVYFNSVDHPEFVFE